MTSEVKPASTAAVNWQRFSSLSQFAATSKWPLIITRADQVLRTALVKPAINSAANDQARSRKTQPTAVSHAAVVLAEFVVRSHFARATLVPTGRLRSSPTLTCWITVH